MKVGMGSVPSAPAAAPRAGAGPLDATGAAPLVGPAAAPLPAATAAGDAKRATSLLRVAQFNVWNLFDDVDTKTVKGKEIKDMVFTSEEYKARVSKIARYIAGHLGAPDILSLNELEGEHVVKALLATPELKGLGYKAVVGDLNDGRGIRVGIIYRADKVEVDKVEEFNPDIKMWGGHGQIDPDKLYARAPLAVDFRLTGALQAAQGVQNLTVVTNHFKSKLGGSSHEPRRQAQGKLLGGWVDARRAANPATPMIVLGDFNATPQDGAYRNLSRRDDNSYRLYDAAARVPKRDRYTYNYRGSHDLLDHLFYTPDLKKALVKTEITHLNTPPEAKKLRMDPSTFVGTSDHDPIMATFDLSKIKVAKPAPAAA